MMGLSKRYRAGMSSSEFAKVYMRYLADIASNCDFQSIGMIIDTLLNARQQGNTVYFIGNGGSASTASHFANDIAIGASRSKAGPAFKAMSLTDNMAVITAVANDDGYENIFSSQLEPIVCPGDVLLALSVSGNSANVVQGARTAQEKGAIVIGCTGFNGGKLKEIADISFHIPCEHGEYGPVEDMFSLLDHCITCYVLLSENGTS